MKHKRRYPYGYEMKQGVFVIIEEEAEVIRRIYRDNIGGKSGTRITEEILTENIPLFNESYSNTMNRVYKILRAEYYTGNGKYPQIISEEEYRQAQAAIHIKKRKDRSDMYSILKTVAYCTECGKGFYRYGDSTRIRKWHCLTEGCANYLPRLTDEDFMGMITEILNSVIADTDLLNTNIPISEYSPTVEIVRQQNEIERLKAMKPIDFDRLKIEMVRLAEMKYDRCTYNDTQHTTKELKERVGEYSVSDMADKEMISSCVKKIGVSPEHKITVEFINGVTITTERK